MKRITLPPSATTTATKDQRPGDSGRSNSWRVIDALSGHARWHAVHLEYAKSGKTGKFYRVYICENGTDNSITQWGARPDDSSTHFNYGDRGQYRPTLASKAREILRQKIGKGYVVVAEGEFDADKTSTGASLSKTFDSLNPTGALKWTSRPLWHGWCY